MFGKEPGTRRGGDGCYPDLVSPASEWVETCHVLLLGVQRLTEGKPDLNLYRVVGFKTKTRAG